LTLPAKQRSITNHVFFRPRIASGGTAQAIRKHDKAMRSHPLLSFLALVCLLGPLYTVHADDHVSSEEAARLQETGEVVPKEQILERARAKHPGKVTEVGLKQKNGKYVYEVDIVDSKRVKRELTYDARTGEFLASKKDDDDGDDDD
jgi:hypothetical protein